MELRVGPAAGDPYASALPATLRENEVIRTHGRICSGQMRSWWNLGRSDLEMVGIDERFEAARIETC
jgi:hypothetical protein